MTLKSQLLASGAFGGMTANERRLGRFIRDGEGHPDPAPAPEPAPSELEGDKDYLDFERSLEENNEDPGEEPGESGEGDAGEEAPPAPVDEGEPKPDPMEDLRRELAAEREAREALERKLAEPAPKEPTSEERSADQAPDPANYEFGEADAKFIADTARWHARQEFQTQEQQRELRTQINELENNWKASIAQPEFVEKYPDFAEKVTKGGDEGKWDCSPLGAILIKSSPVGGDVAYHLASNPSEAAEIAKLSIPEQSRAIGRLEGRFLAERAASNKPAPKVVTDAPEPPARTRGAGGKFAVEADTTDFSAFEKMADAAMEKKK